MIGAGRCRFAGGAVPGVPGSSKYESSPDLQVPCLASASSNWQAPTPGREPRGEQMTTPIGAAIEPGPSTR